MLRPILACGAVAVAIPAFAQTPLFPSSAPSCAIKNSGTYGPVSFAPNPTKRNCEEKLGSNEPACIGRSSYPISDWKYIRQFCGPTVAPGSNFGHFPTKWRKWDDRTPEVIYPAPYQNIPAPVSEPLDKPKEEPKDKPKGDPMPPPMDKPKKEPAEKKIPEAVKLESLPAPRPYPANLDLFLPVVPPAPPAPMPILPSPKEPVKILPSEFSRPMVDTTPRIVAPQPEAVRPVVPPQPNFK